MTFYIYIFSLLAYKCWDGLLELTEMPSNLISRHRHFVFFSIFIFRRAKDGQSMES